MASESSETKDIDDTLSDLSASLDASSTERVRALLLEHLDIRDRRYRLKTYTQCFLGSDAVALMLEHGIAHSEDDAVLVGQVLVQDHAIAHVTRDHDFKNEGLFYRFLEHEESHGRNATTDGGEPVSWAQFARQLLPGAAAAGGGDDRGARQPSVPGPSQDTTLPAHLQHVDVRPLDAHNTALLDHVHPPAWEDPEGAGRYNLVVVGAGAGGLVSAAGAAGVGAKVALIEEELLGGDCLNVGCVPSKALIACANAAHAARSGGPFGVRVEGEVTVDFGAVMERMRRIRASIAPNDSADRFSKLGVDVFMGRGTFVAPNQVEVNGKTLTFAKAVVATGARAAVPPIPGLADAPYLTNATFFNLTEMPARMIVIGGGPIGMELAQAMQRFGCEVSVCIRSDHIMSKEDPEAADIVQRQMADDGVRFFTGCRFVRVESDAAAGSVTVVVEREGLEVALEADALLVGAGRKPNVEGLGLEAAGVRFDALQGVQVDDHLQTSNSRVFAVGDVCTQYKFTHVADFMARMVIRNALFFGSGKMSSLLIPWVTFTEPEVAHVGLYEADCADRGLRFDAYTRHFDDVDRAICDGETEGFVRVLCKKGSDEILGATIVSPHAGNLINEITLAMQNGIGLGALAAVIHPYPTHGEAVRQAGDMFNKTRLTLTVKALLRNLLALQR